MTGTVPTFVAVNALTGTVCMEQLQEGYVASVAATAGCLFNKLERDVYGFDVLLVDKKDPSQQESSLYVQLKCTTSTRPDPTAADFGFRLKKREYFERLAA